MLSKPCGMLPVCWVPGWLHMSKGQMCSQIITTQVRWLQKLEYVQDISVGQRGKGTAFPGVFPGTGEPMLRIALGIRTCSRDRLGPAMSLVSPVPSAPGSRAHCLDMRMAWVHIPVCLGKLVYIFGFLMWKRVICWRCLLLGLGGQRQKWGILTTKDFRAVASWLSGTVLCLFISSVT